MTITQLKAYKRKAKAQRDNWKLKADAYYAHLKFISDHFLCCGKCSGPFVYCPVGWARKALIMEKKKGVNG